MQQCLQKFGQVERDKGNGDKWETFSFSSKWNREEESQVIMKEGEVVKKLEREVGRS